MDNLQKLTLANVVEAQAQNLPNLEILRFVHVDSHKQLHSETLTYQQLLDNASALAGFINTKQNSATGNIALMMNNHPEFVETMVACSILGLPFVPIDPRARGLKLAYMLSHTDCEGLVCADYCLEQVLEILDENVGLRWVLCVSDTSQAKKAVTANSAAQSAVLVEDYRQALSAGALSPPPAPASPASPMFMMFTSGTTGNPKAVVVSQQQYMAQADALKKMGANDSDVFYTGLSLTHINAQNFLRNGLALGIPVVISRKFSKSKLWDICREYQCTIFSLLGGMIPEIYAVPEQDSDADNPVRLVLSSGMPASIWRDFERRFGLTLFEVYGSTEGGGLVNPPGIGPVGSIGKPAPDWEADILDPQGLPCAAGEEGEICFRREDRQPIVVQYYKNDQASADKVSNGWLHMGDVGHKDAEGWFFFHHRVGGGVRRNGDFVNTAIVESTLMQSPLVQDVFVYGVALPQNVAGEKTLVAAIVVASHSDYSEQALRDFCQSHLEKNDIPEIIQVLEAIPKTVSEKPIEKECIALLNL